MNILQRLHKSPTQFYRYRVRVFNKSPNETLPIAPVPAAAAAYSICSTKRNQTLRPPIAVQFQSRRNRSFAEIITDTYTAVSHSTTVSYFQNGLISFHDMTGLPWWATVIVYTVGLRVATFPLAVYGQVMKGKIENIIRIEVPKMEAELKTEVAMAQKRWHLTDRETYMLYRRSFRKQYRQMIERDNCHPMKSTVLLWFQIPIWICHSVGIRNVLQMQPDPMSLRAIGLIEQLSIGGCLWIPNLLQTDATYILPAIWCITNLINIELSALERSGQPSKVSTILTGIFRVITIAIVPIAATVPSCLTLYWSTSALCALAQNLILLSPRAKVLFGIPTNPTTHLERPYRTLAIRFVEQMHQRKDWCASLLKLKKIEST